MACGRPASPVEYGDNNNKADIGSCDLLVGLVLNYLPVRDLFVLSEVNDVWERVCHALLREKLKWVLCSSQPENDGDQSSCLRSFCAEVRTVCTIAREAGKRVTLCFLLMSAFRDDERTVIQKVRQAMPFDCVIALFKSKRHKHVTFKQTRNGLNGCLVFDSINNLSTLIRLRAYHVRASKAYRVDQVTASPRYHTTTKARHHVRLRKFEAKFGRTSPGAHGLRRVSKFIRRLVSRERPDCLDASFRNTAPGVFTFTSKLSVPLMDGGRFSSYYAERATGHKIQVSTAALLAKMKRRSMEALLSLRDTLKDDSRAIVVVFQSDPVDAFVMEHIRCVFRDYPIVILGGQAVREVSPTTAADCTATPLGCDGVTVMVLKLMPVDSALKKVNTAKNS